MEKRYYFTVKKYDCPGLAVEPVTRNPPQVLQVSVTAVKVPCLEGPSCMAFVTQITQQWMLKVL